MTKKALTEAMLKRFEKNLRGMAEMGSALAMLGREILRDVKSAEIAIASIRQRELPLLVTTPQEDREKRYEENTKRISRAMTPRKKSK